MPPLDSYTDFLEQVLLERDLDARTSVRRPELARDAAVPVSFLLRHRCFPIMETTLPVAQPFFDCLAESTVSSCLIRRADSKNSKRRMQPAQLSRANSNWIGCATTTQQLPPAHPIGRDEIRRLVPARSCCIVQLRAKFRLSGSRGSLFARFFSLSGCEFGTVSDPILFACSPMLSWQVSLQSAGYSRLFENGAHRVQARHVIELRAELV